MKNRLVCISLPNSFYVCFCVCGVPNKFTVLIPNILDIAHVHIINHLTLAYEEELVNLVFLWIREFVVSAMLFRIHAQNLL